jgi:hypothetical protein
MRAKLTHTSRQSQCMPHVQRAPHAPHATRASHPAFALLALLLCLLPAGCDNNRPGSKIPEVGAGATWRWRATSMKVSALTTPFPATSGELAALDVRVTFFDKDQDETKALGTLTITVTSSGVELARSEIQLSNEYNHSQHWDSVTETYSVRLPLSGGSEPQPGQTLDVRSIFEGDDGSLMKASRDVKWPRNERATPAAEPTR